MKKLNIILLTIAISVGIMQFLGPDEPRYLPVRDLTGVPKEINAMIRTACFDCHSTQTDLRWYDQIAPASYLTYDHITKGRAALDFSKWDSLETATQNVKLYYALNKVLMSEMPLPSYAAIHPDATLAEHDIKKWKDFMISRTPRRQVDSVQIALANQQFSDFANGTLSVPKEAVKSAPNGIAYISDYRDWKVINISDRFDNGTMRIIYGNDIAVAAILKHAINPWPDGAILAKAAWKQQTNHDGSISTGEFAQVEFMIKDNKKYATTAGWGWARWRGVDLTPYGGDALFATECIACHLPLKENDYVFTKPINLAIQ